jgi:glutathione synthase/RimK-type ligase-like ATP-grasp enzyme
MPQSVFILADAMDSHAVAINWALRRKGVSVVQSPSIPTHANARHTLHMSPTGQDLLSSSFPDGVTSIWHRRPGDPVPNCLEVDRAFVAQEWRWFQRNVFGLNASITDALWVNKPHAAQNAENKFVQLQACKEVGLNFPEAVSTNDAGEVKKLIDRCGRVVFKTFSQHMWDVPELAHLLAVDVKVLDKHSELPEEAIAVCPGIYQRFIEKVYDIRVTVIGNRLFPISIRRATGDTYVDWRPNIHSTETIVEEVSLPGDLAERIYRFMSRLGLVFGCLDLVVDADNNVYVLEVNQAGQFLFVEEQVPHLPIMQAMTEMLATGRVDYSLDSSSRITLKDYFSSDEFGRFRAEYEREKRTKKDPERVTTE